MSQCIRTKTVYADDTLDVEIDGAAGTLTDSIWSGYEGVLGGPPLQVDVTMYYPSSHLKTTIHDTRPKKTYPDGSWRQETTLSEFQSNRLCGLGRR